MGSFRRSRKIKKSKERREQRRISEEAMIYLCEESLKNRLNNPQYSQNLFHDARKIGQRGRLHLPADYRFLFCRSCNTPFSIKTAKIRLNSTKNQIHYQCLICRHEHRFGYGKQKNNARKN